MRTHSALGHVLVWCAAFGVIVPLAPLSAVAADANSVVRDVALTAEGAFQGQFIGQDGLPVSAAAVVVRSEGEAVAESMTDVEGRFEIAGLQPGVYDVSVGSTTETIRVWSNEAAPPTAATGALMAQDVVRAQYGADYGTMGVVFGIIGIGLATAALVEAHNHDHDSSP
jgi:hypothetical protein